MENNSFSGALEALKTGKKVARSGWNAHHILELQVPDENSKMGLPYIYLTVGAEQGELAGKRVPWVASQTDLLSNDWVVVE